MNERAQAQRKKTERKEMNEHLTKATAAMNVAWNELRNAYEAANTECAMLILEPLMTRAQKLTHMMGTALRAIAKDGSK